MGEGRAGGAAAGREAGAGAGRPGPARRSGAGLSVREGSGAGGCGTGAFLPDPRMAVYMESCARGTGPPAACRAGDGLVGDCGRLA